MNRTLARRLGNSSLVMAAAATALWAFAAQPASAKSAATGRVLLPREIAQRDQPAVELIETDVVGSLTYHKIALNTDAVAAWAQNDQTVQAAGNAGNYGDVTRTIIAQLAANPGNYITAGDGVPVNDELVYQGSGFNVTPDGYIVTNAHVASISKSEAIQGFLQDSFSQVQNALTQSLANQLASIDFSGVNLPVPDDQVAHIGTLVSTFLNATTTAGNVVTTVYGGGGPNLSLNLNHKGTVARVVAAGDVFPGKDVAILKIEAHNLPTVAIGDDTTLQTGDSVHAIGYPGDATFDPTTVADTVTASSTLSDGTVSNRLQSSKANYQYIENTATINHGNSGGALLNDLGQVVGITTASDTSTESKNGINGGKFFYAVPASVVNEFLTANHVVPSSSADQTSYNQALDLIANSHWKAALTKLRLAETDGYSTPYLQDKIDQAVQAAAKGQDKPVSSSSTAPVLIGGVVAVVVLALLALVVIRRKRRPGASIVVSPNPVSFTGGPPYPASSSPLPLSSSSADPTQPLPATPSGPPTMPPPLLSPMGMPPPVPPPDPPSPSEPGAATPSE
jgi:serine protease Do